MPAWIGFNRSPDSQSMVLLYPTQDDGRELSISWGSSSTDWSAVESSRQLRHVDPSAELKASGVRSIVVRPSSGSDRTKPDRAEVHLFVDNAAGRYLLTLTVDAPPAQVTSALAMTALRQAGFSFR